MSKVPTRALVLVAVMMATGCGASKQHTNIARQGEELRYDLAKLYADRGVHRAAVPLLQKILLEDPKDVRARVLYGKVLRDLGLHPQAEGELRYALKLAPTNHHCHAEMGILYDLQRKPKLARKHHVEAVRLAPGMARYRNNLGFSLYLAGDYEAAIRQLRQALAMDPSMAVAYNNLGFAYGRLRRFQSAEKTFRSALSEASTLINMALIYEQHGDADRANAMRTAAYTIDPDLRPEGDGEQEKL